MAVIAENPADAVSVSAQSLVRLHAKAAGISLLPNRIGAQTAGNYLSRFKGRGMEYAESRPYEPGDDARNLHWRVMARTGKPFTKQFREERERPVLVWVDLRSRMFFGTRVALKAVVASRCAALIAWAANRIGDRIGGVIFSDRMHHEIKPVRGKAAVLFLIKMLVEHPAWTEHKQVQSGHSAREAMIRLRRVVRPGSRIILLSDFANFDAATESNLAQLARHSEITLLHIYDPLEASLPPPGRYRLSDGAAELVMDTADARYRASYAEKFTAHVDHLRSFSRRHRISYLSCRTDQDPVTVLRKELGAQRAV